MKQLDKNFKDRTSLIEYVKTLSDWADGDASHIAGGTQQAYEKLNQIEPIEYGRTRNLEHLYAMVEHIRYRCSALKD